MKLATVLLFEKEFIGAWLERERGYSVFEKTELLNEFEQYDEVPYKERATLWVKAYVDRLTKSDAKDDPKPKETKETKETKRERETRRTRRQPTETESRKRSLTTESESLCKARKVDVDLTQDAEETPKYKIEDFADTRWDTSIFDYSNSELDEIEDVLMEDDEAWEDFMNARNIRWDMEHEA